MTRLLPYPLMCAGLFVLWLLLTQSLAPGHILLGGLIAVAGGWALARVEVPVARVRRLAAILHLSGLVVADIVRSNIAVLRIILGVAGHQRRAGFVDIPLDDGRSALPKNVELFRVDVDAYDCVALVCKACGTHRADIAETENTDLHPVLIQGHRPFGLLPASGT